MKNLFLIALLILTGYSYNVQAQVKNIEYSVPFTEPVDSWNKILQLSNGYTFLFKFGKEGISLIAYNKERRFASKKTLNSTLWDPKKVNTSSVSGIYEIDGQPVIFLHQTIKRVPTLFRIQLNPKNGAIMKQKKIGELKKYKIGAGYAMAFGDVDQANFFIQKDPNSSSYIQINYNSFASESDKRLEVVMYNVENGIHKEINRSFYNSGGYKYTKRVASLVINNTAYLFTYGYNTKSSGGKDTRIIAAKLLEKGNGFVYNKIEFTNDFSLTSGIAKYNPHAGMIQLLTQTHLKNKNNKNYYGEIVSYIDPESLQVTKKQEVSLEEVNEYIKRKKLSTIPYHGLSQDMVINKDNSTTFLSEEETIETVSYKGSTKFYTTLGSVGLVTLDYTGSNLNSVCIQKSHNILGTVPSFYHYYKKNGRNSIPKNNRVRSDRHFYSFSYINTSKNNSYIIFNDHPKNFDLVSDNDLISVGAISECATVYSKISYNKVEKNYLLGTPNIKSRQNSFTAIGSSSFLNDTYAALVIKKNGRTKKAYVAWITFN